MVIFCLQVWKGSENAKKTKRLSHKDLKKQLIELMVNNNTVETDELNKKSEEVRKTKDAAAVVKHYEYIIRTKQKGIIFIAYHQGKVFKEFKDKEKFIKLVNEFKLHKTNIIFNINIFKLIGKYPKLMKSSIGSGFFRNYYKDI